MCQAQASVVVNRRRAHVVGLVPGGLRVADPLDRLAKWTDDDDHPCSWLGVNYDTCTGCMTSLSLLAALLPGRLLPCNNLYDGFFILVYRPAEDLYDMFINKVRRERLPEMLEQFRGKVHGGRLSFGVFHWIAPLLSTMLFGIGT
ncbi:putative LRR receptor-like serine/threonine-protein kinase IRK [Hordeum vulgare]|nr:putative LRR receptor-like serine/threonine-protein kinase IRK [Hordeum vulgare]